MSMEGYRAKKRIIRRGRRAKYNFVGRVLDRFTPGVLNVPSNRFTT